MDSHTGEPILDAHRGTKGPTTEPEDGTEIRWPVEIVFGGHSIRSWVEAPSSDAAVGKVLEEVDVFVEDEPITVPNQQ